MRRLFVFALLAVSLLLMGSSAYTVDDGDYDADSIKWALSLMHRALVIDTHADTIGYVLDQQYDMSIRNDEHHIDIPRMIESGMNCELFACWISPTDQKGWEIRRTLDMIDALYGVAEKDDRFEIAYSAEDILRIKKEGKVAGMLCIEGGHAIEDDLSALRMFHRLGVRYMTLTWMNNNNWADGSAPDQERYGNIPSKGGLNDFGREVVREMNRLGMMVDISHVHDDTFWDVMEIVTKPVIASHSSAYAINPHYRNLKDEQLRAVARNGGVVGINFYSAFLSKEYGDASEAIRGRYYELREQYKDDQEGFRRELRKLSEGMPEVPISLLVDHIEHVAKVAGVDHVGLGSDFDGISAAPEGIDDVTDLVWIVIELRNRGWSEIDLRKFLGENFLRVIKANVGS